MLELFEASYLPAFWQLDYRRTLRALKHSEAPTVGRGQGALQRFLTQKDMCQLYKSGLTKTAWDPWISGVTGTDLCKEIPESLNVL